MGNMNYKEILEKDLLATSTNYANMYDRLHRRNTITKFLIVYYSVIAILYTILPKYFIYEEAIKNILDFCSVVISIILLVASLSVSMANYSARETRIIQSIDLLKRLKKELQAKHIINKKDFFRYINRYHEIVDSMELRTNYDYYLTRKKLKKEISHWEYIIFPILHFLELIMYIILICCPILIISIVLFF